MAILRATTPAAWAPALGVALILGYVLYQALGWRRLRRLHLRLCELGAGQRRLYEALQAVQRRADDLAAQVPSSARPAPYLADDERAIALCADLLQRVGGLRWHLRSPEPGVCPRFGLACLLRNSYWADLRTLHQELAFAESQRRGLQRAEALAAELQAVLDSIDRKPLAVQTGLVGLLALADNLAQQVERGRQRGSEGLTPLLSEIQALRTQAREGVERLKQVRAAEAVQTTVAAEALRLQLMARIAALQGQVEGLAGLHDRALSEQERLDEALQNLEEAMAALRPALAGMLRPAARVLQEQRESLTARGGLHDAAGPALRLTAQAHSLIRQIRRLDEADREAAQALPEIEQGLDELTRQVQEEEGQTEVRLDLSRTALERAGRYVTELQSQWARGPDSLCDSDPAAATTMLGQVHGLIASCRRELEAGRETLAAWQSQRRRMQEILARVSGSAPEHERLALAWRGLAGYAHGNWSQVSKEWYDGYLQMRQALQAEERQIEALLRSGQALESTGGELLARCENLEQRWRGLVHSGRQVTVALGQVRALERQALEGLAALRIGVQAVARIAEELPADIPEADEVRGLSKQILDLYRTLDDEALRPQQADYRRLRDEGNSRLQEQIALHRTAHARLLEDMRTALKRQIVRIWSRWEPLSQRLGKARPASEVDDQALGRRWQLLVRDGRGSLNTLPEILDCRAQADSLWHDIAQAQGQFDAECEAVGDAEQRLANGRRVAGQLREHLLKLIGKPYPQVVGEEWDRCTKAWARAEDLLRRLEPQRGVRLYLAHLAEATTEYEEARVRGRSALVRLLRYAFLEDPDGMHVACRPLGRRWEQLGLTVREEHISDLLADAEQAGNVGQLVDRVGAYLAGWREAPATKG